MKSNILIFSLTLVFAYSLQAVQVYFSGVAAKSIYICDTWSDFNCWFAHGSYCRLKCPKPSYEILKNKKIKITGKLAKKIYYLTRNCRPKAKKSCHQEGIICKNLLNSYSCKLDYDLLEIIHK